MRNVIIFCGPDRCGKTTIAKCISERFSIPYFKNYNQKSYFLNIDPVARLHYEGDIQIQMLEQTGYSIVKDRDYPCEYSYSKVFNRKTDLAYLFELDVRYAALGTVIVYCYKDKYTEYEDAYVDQTKINNIKKYYEEFLKDTACAKIALNTTDENLENQIKLITRYINKE